ncbi:transposase [Streptomyces sp. HYC2]|uniref:transposase n=1 Tax=Streptomyces sp. HYC2 TaxID=2955207 RepID=UPI002480DC6F|nr:transposase [Streptomyces sp. HYC2]
MGRVSAEKRRAAVERLSRLREDEALTAAHVRTVAGGLGVSERTVWRWLAPQKPSARAARPRYELSETDRDALAFYRGNVAAVVRARRAVTDGDGTTAGAPVPDFLAEGWASAKPVPERTLYRAFTIDLTPAERAAWKSGEAGRRAGSVYLRRSDALRGRCWEMDHKQLPILVLPPKGKALAPWLTTVVDDGTRALLGWAIAVTPTSGTVLTAMRMALTHEPDISPFGAVPELVRIDRGLEFAASAVKEVLGGLAVVMHRLPAFTPHRKGKVERLNLTIEQMLISQLPGFTGGPRDAGGRLYGPIKDSAAAQCAAETAADGTGPLRLERFVKRFADWVRWYNIEHRHRMLAGRTRSRHGKKTRHRCGASPPTSCATSCSLAPSGSCRRTASTSTACPTSPPSCTDAAGNGSRSATCRTTTAPLRSTTAGRTCAPPTRPVSSPRCRPRRSAHTPAPRPTDSAGNGAVPPGRPAAPSPP